jgi:hypothetical protein
MYAPQPASQPARQAARQARQARQPGSHRQPGSQAAASRARHLHAVVCFCVVLYVFVCVFEEPARDGVAKASDGDLADISSGSGDHSHSSGDLADIGSCSGRPWLRFRI